MASGVEAVPKMHPALSIFEQARARADRLDGSNKLTAEAVQKIYMECVPFEKSISDPNALGRFIVKSIEKDMDNEKFDSSYTHWWIVQQYSNECGEGYNQTGVAIVVGLVVTAVTWFFTGRPSAPLALKSTLARRVASSVFCGIAAMLSIAGKIR